MRRSILGNPVGLIVGPPSGGATGPSPGSLGPILGPPMEEAAPTGPMQTISVEPEVTPIDGGFFFGPNAPAWFWPYGYGYPSYPKPVRLVCRKQEIEDDEVVLECRRERYPVTYVYGPPSWWW